MAYFFLLITAPFMAWQSGHFEEPKAATPTRRNNAVHPWMFQKSHMPTSLSRKTTPNAKSRTPHMLVHFLHTHIAYTSFF